jgi:hypothetical protein
MPNLISSAIDAVVGRLADTFKANKSINDFFPISRMQRRLGCGLCS